MFVYIRVQWHHFNSLPNDKFLDPTKFKAFANDKSIVPKIMISQHDRVENTVEKKRKCWLQAFSPFLTMFSKGFFLRVVKSRNFLLQS